MRRVFLAGGRKFKNVHFGLTFHQFLTVSVQWSFQVHPDVQWSFRSRIVWITSYDLTCIERNHWKGQNLIDLINFWLRDNLSLCGLIEDSKIHIDHLKCLTDYEKRSNFWIKRVWSFADCKIDWFVFWGDLNLQISTDQPKECRENKHMSNCWSLQMNFAQIVGCFLCLRRLTICTFSTDFRSLFLSSWSDFTFSLSEWWAVLTPNLFW
jgi:hypothetical protein